MGAQPLCSVPTSTTDPHVTINDIDMSWRDLWRQATFEQLQVLGSTLEGNFRIFWVKGIDWKVDGWSAGFGSGNDGYVLLRTKRRGPWRQYKEVLRITGPRDIGANYTEVEDARPGASSFQILLLLQSYILLAFIFQF